MDGGKVLQKTSPLLIAVEQKNTPYFRKISQQHVSVTLNSTLPEVKISLPSGCPSLEKAVIIGRQGQRVHRLLKISLEVGKC